MAADDDNSHTIQFSARANGALGWGDGVPVISSSPRSDKASDTRDGRMCQPRVTNRPLWRIVRLEHDDFSLSYVFSTSRNIPTPRLHQVQDARVLARHLSIFGEERCASSALPSLTITVLSDIGICLMESISTREAARKLGISLISLQRYIAAKKITAPKLQNIGGVRIRLWTARDIKRVRKELPGLKNGRSRRKH
jgi:hypothetical protein